VMQAEQRLKEGGRRKVERVTDEVDMSSAE
jgi:hypothetical protein